MSWSNKASRREAFKTLGGLVACGAGAFTIVHYIARRDPAADETVEVGPLSGFAVGVFESRIVIVTEHSTWSSGPAQKTIWLRRNPDDTFLVFSGTCPHMNCTITAGAGNTFECPCHKSQFDSEGSVLLAPAPRGLDALAYKVSAEGEVSVQFQNFRKGLPDKILA